MKTHAFITSTPNNYVIVLYRHYCPHYYSVFKWWQSFLKQLGMYGLKEAYEQKISSILKYPLKLERYKYIEKNQILCICICFEPPSFPYHSSIGHVSDNWGCHFEIFLYSIISIISMWGLLLFIYLFIFLSSFVWI